MDNKAKKLLFDIQTAISNIDTYIGAIKTFEQYDNNPALRISQLRNHDSVLLTR